jgi:hypothetical protein
MHECTMNFPAASSLTADRTRFNQDYNRQSKGCLWELGFAQNCLGQLLADWIQTLPDAREIFLFTLEHSKATICKIRLVSW